MGDANMINRPGAAHPVWIRGHRLLWSTTWVVSPPLSDIDQLFYPLRVFAFGQMRGGHLPLWNPYQMGGIPAFANSLYALLYPPNWLHLILPDGLAINLVVASHVMLSGLFTAIWCRSRGASVGASLLAGSMFMFCGPQMLRVYGGIATYPCVIAWTPLLMLCIDAIIDGNRPAIACLAGGAVLTLQILAGYMLAVYYQSFGIGCYALVRLVNHPRWTRAALWLIAMGVLALALSAGQLLPGFEAATESVRGTAQQGSFSTSVSLAPEHLLTLVTPYLLGDTVSAPIFQRWGIVDTSLFIGAVGTAAALIGAIHAIRTRSMRDIALLLAMLLTLAVALGEYNPLYGIAMRIIPGLSLFRGPSRASFMITLPAAALAAAGVDALRKSRPSIATIALIAIAGTIFAAAALIVGRSAEEGFDGLWGRMLMSLISTGQTWAKLDSPRAPLQIQTSATLASQQLIAAAGVLGTFALIVLLSRSRPGAIHLLIPLALIELWCGSVLAWDRHKPTTQPPAGWEQAIARRGTDDRVLILRGGEQNMPMQFGVESIGGYDPALRQRWEDVVAGLLNSEIHTGNLAARRFLRSDRWPMLRLAATIPPDPNILFDPPMPRLNLIARYTVVRDSNESLLAVRRPSFNPREQVILEQEPAIKPLVPPDAGTLGTATGVWVSTDVLEVTATVQMPALLLITDAYSRGWRVEPLEPAPQQEYEILPADHALRAIPLAAGHHHFLLRYRPRSVVIGAFISAVAFSGSIVAIILLLWRRRSRAI
jgi:hypothetical protein